MGFVKNLLRGRRKKRGKVDPLDLAGKWVVLFEAGGPKMRPALQRVAAAGAAGAIGTPAPVSAVSSGCLGSPCSPSMRASPQSRTSTSPKSPLMMLSGFRSRCTIPLA